MDKGRQPSISDEAVRAKTGRVWEEWFAVLDAASAITMSHTEMARYLREEQGVPPWWSQMVANAYEQARGLRKKHQMPQGYQVSVSKTLGAPVSALYRAWADDEVRGRWLGEPATVRQAVPHKSMRMTWADGEMRVEVAFYAKGDSRTQVVVQHSRLADAGEAERMKRFWRGKLERLGEVVG